MTKTNCPDCPHSRDLHTDLGCIVEDCIGICIVPWDVPVKRCVKSGKPMPPALAKRLLTQYETGETMRYQMAEEREKYFEFMHKTASFIKGLVKPHGLPKWWDEMRETLEEAGEDCCHFDTHDSSDSSKGAK